MVTSPARLDDHFPLRLGVAAAGAVAGAGAGAAKGQRPSADFEIRADGPASRTRATRCPSGADTRASTGIFGGRGHGSDRLDVDSRRVGVVVEGEPGVAGGCHWPSVIGLNKARVCHSRPVSSTIRRDLRGKQSCLKMPQSQLEAPAEKPGLATSGPICATWETSGCLRLAVRRAVATAVRRPRRTFPGRRSEEPQARALMWRRPGKISLLRGDVSDVQQRRHETSSAGHGFEQFRLTHV